MARLMFQLVRRLSTRATFWPTSSFCIWRMRCNDRLSIWPTLSIHCAMRGIACTWLHRIENKGGDEIRNSTDRYPIVHVGNIFLPELLVCESGWSESHVLQSEIQNSRMRIFTILVLGFSPGFCEAQNVATFWRLVSRLRPVTSSIGTNTRTSL